MNQQDAYVELKKQLDAINDLSHAAQKFAHKHGLMMGTLRNSPHVFDANKPESMRKDEDRAEDQSEEDAWEASASYDEDRFISSSVCW